MHLLSGMLEPTIVGSDSETPVLPDSVGPDVEVWRDGGGTIRAYGYTADGQYWLHLPGVATFRFGSDADGVTAIAPHPMSVDLILETHRRIVLPMALQVAGMEVLHASGVLTHQGVAAVCAFSRMGKSTIAYGLSQRGFTLWADDAVAFEASGEGITAVALPFKIRLRPNSAAFFSRGARVEHGPSEADAVAGGGGGQVPVAAVLVLSRTSAADDLEEVETRRLPPARALQALLPHANCFSLRDSERKRRTIRQYLDLVRTVPVLEIRFRAGLERLPAVLDRIESALNGR